MAKDWTGNGNSVWKNLGASNHTNHERGDNDYYATQPIAIDKLASKFDIPHVVWEPSCGGGHLSKRLEELGHNVVSTDLVFRGYGFGGVNFFDVGTELYKSKWPFDVLGNDYCILTNPPYKVAKDYVLHALDLVKEGQYVIMFLKTTFLEGKARYQELFKNQPPELILQSIERIQCVRNGDFTNAFKGGGALAYAWYIFKKGFHGKTTIDWI